MWLTWKDEEAVAWYGRGPYGGLARRPKAVHNDGLATKMNNLGPSLTLMAVFVVGCNASRAAAPATSPPAPRPEAIRCTLHLSPVAERDQVHRAIVLRPGETKSLSVGGLTLESNFWQQEVRLRVRASERILFEGSYPVERALPVNRHPAEASFTGDLYLAEPDRQDGYRLQCSAIADASEYVRREQRAAQRRQQALNEKTALLETLWRREPCSLSPAQNRAHQRCPLEYPPTARGAAISSLHALAHRSFVGVDLEGANLAAADLRETDMYTARFAGANLERVQLFFARLQYASLDGANLTAANLYGASLTGATLVDAKLAGAKLQETDLDNANLRGADLTGAYVMGASLTGAHLTGARLARTHLMRANLTRADLRSADFAGAKLEGAIVDGADLREARGLTQSQLDKACGDSNTKLPRGLTIRRQPRLALGWTDDPWCAPADSPLATGSDQAPGTRPERLVLARHYAPLFEVGRKWRFQVEVWDPPQADDGQAHRDRQLHDPKPRYTSATCTVQRVHSWPDAVGARLVCDGALAPDATEAAPFPRGWLSGDWVANSEGLWLFEHEVLDGPQPELTQATRLIAAAPVASPPQQQAVHEGSQSTHMTLIRHLFCVTRRASRSDGDESGDSYCFAAGQGPTVGKCYRRGDAHRELRFCTDPGSCRLLP